MRFAVLLVIGVAMVLTAGAAQCTVLWDESVNGDLPDRTTVMDLGTLAVGSNVVLGSIGAHQWWSSDQEDSGAFTVSTGQTLSKVVFGPYSSYMSPDWVGFALYKNAQLLAFFNVNSLAEGADLLQASTDHPGPLSAGNYSFLWQGTGDQEGKSGYTVDFVVQSVPEPSCLLAVSGLLMAFALRRRLRA